MSKFCSECGFPHVFSRGLCLKHWKEKHQKPIPTTLKKPSKIAPKRLKQVQRYNSLINRLDAANETQICFFCNLSIVGRADHHHLEGRDGEKLIDDRLVVPTHRECHTKWHSLSVHRLSKEQWWNGYLMRLQALSEKEYNKTMRKFDK